MKKSLRSLLLLAMTSIGTALVLAAPAGADVSTPGSTAETVPAVNAAGASAFSNTGTVYVPPR